MIREVDGDLLTCEAEIICHQVNYFGVMGGGVALAIKDKMLLPASYKEYQRYCATAGDALLGQVYMVMGRGKIVANMFSQMGEPGIDGGLTDYDALRKCLQYVLRRAQKLHVKAVAVPGYIGCGIAGGNWDKVRTVLNEVFGRTRTVDLLIVYKDRRQFW